MINIEELYELQAKLDEEIAINHQVTYESTHSRRLLALIIELGELANETRCFKYWSLKGPSPIEVIKDEYADGLHFLLSLGIPLKANKFDYEISANEGDLTSQFFNMYKLALELLDNYDLKTYEKAFSYYLNMSKSIGMTESDIIDSYKAKLKVNHIRQETKY